MKAIFWLLVIIFVAGVLFLFSNSLRCLSRKNVLACPNLCISKPIKCDPELQVGCEKLVNCNAPALKQYQDYIQELLEQTKNKLIK